MNKDYRPALAHMHVNDVQRITLQRDLEHDCIDIVLLGSDKYYSARISVWAHDHWEEKALPVVEMLPDVPVKEPDNAETDA